MVFFLKFCLSKWASQGSELIDLYHSRSALWIFSKISHKDRKVLNISAFVILSTHSTNNTY